MGTTICVVKFRKLFYYTINLLFYHTLGIFTTQFTILPHIGHFYHTFTKLLQGVYSRKGLAAHVQFYWLTPSHHHTSYVCHLRLLLGSFFTPTTHRPNQIHVPIHTSVQWMESVCECAGRGSPYRSACEVSCHCAARTPSRTSHTHVVSRLNA